MMLNLNAKKNWILVVGTTKYHSLLSCEESRRVKKHYRNNLYSRRSKIVILGFTANFFVYFVKVHFVYVMYRFILLILG